MSMHTTNVTRIIAAGDCDDCGNRYQVAAIKSNGDQGVDVRCPHCGSIHFAREFESFFENVDEEHQPSVVQPASPDWLRRHETVVSFTGGRDE